MSSYGLSEVNCRVCEQKRGTYDEPDVDSKVLPAFQFSPDDYQGGRRVIGSLLHKNVPRILNVHLQPIYLPNLSLARSEAKIAIGPAVHV